MSELSRALRILAPECGTSVEVNQEGGRVLLRVRDLYEDTEVNVSLFSHQARDLSRAIHEAAMLALRY